MGTDTDRSTIFVPILNKADNKRSPPFKAKRYIIVTINITDYIIVV